MKRRRSVVSIDDMSDDDIGRLFFTARSMEKNWAQYKAKYHGGILMTAFFEASTRTRLSFEMAALRLGFSITAFHTASSSMSKGESVAATIENLVAMCPDILVIRQKEQWHYASLLAVHEHIAFINGGDGIGEHPSQALLDCFTLLNHFKSDDFQGKRILIIGDLAHSRVAHSNIKLMKRLHADITLLSPDVFRPTETAYSMRWYSQFSQCVDDYDAVMCLRIQKERMAVECGFSDDAYYQHYALTTKRLNKLGKGCVVMHPGPMNLGVEIDEAVAYGDSSLIAAQVRNGVLIRAALIDHCLT